MEVKKPKGLMERLHNNETVICAEGYLFAFERRGYLSAGAFVPEVVLEHPELVRQQYEEFVHAGSDVVLAFTYYAHRAKMDLIGREGELERINREALRMAREVADQTGTLMAGNISNTNLFNESPDCEQQVWNIFKEQVEWIADSGADFIVGETFNSYREALLATKACKEFAKDIPCVITLVIHLDEVDGKPSTVDKVEVCDALNRLAEAGADVVGVNCARGPETMLPILEDAAKFCKAAPLAALPVMYRTTKETPNMFSLKDPKSGEPVFPVELDCVQCSRKDIAEFGQRVQELGIKYVGLCCGNSAHYTRALAESLGRKPPASRYSPNLNKHWLLGKDDKFADIGEGVRRKYQTFFTPDAATD